MPMLHRFIPIQNDYSIDIRLLDCLFQKIVLIRIKEIMLNLRLIGGKDFLRRL